MTRLTHALTAIATLVALPCAAGVVSIQPTNPTSVNPIVIVASTPFAQLELQPVVVAGAIIQLTFRGYADLPIAGEATASIGPLPAGTYTVVVTHVILDQDGNLFQTITDPPVILVVASAGNVPTLEVWALIVLAGAVSVGGVVMTRRL